MFPDEEDDDTARSIRLNVPSTRVMQAKPQNSQNSQKQPNNKQFTIVPDYTNVVAYSANVVPDYANVLPDYANIVSYYANVLPDYAKDI